MDNEKEDKGLLARILGWFKGPVEDLAPDPDLADTAPLSPDNLEQISTAKIRESLEAGSAQSVGLERENNEDGRRYPNDDVPSLVEHGRTTVHSRARFRFL